MPSQTTQIQVAGRKIQMAQGGAGPPLLYLHSAAGETEWSNFHQLLGQSHRILLPAHPGFALSNGLESILDIQDLAWHYVDLLESLGISRIPVVGFSLGGWLAAEIAVLRPHLFEKLILVASAGIRLPEVTSPDIFLDDMDELRRLLFYDSESQLAQDFLPRSHTDERMLFWIRAREASARVAWNPYLHNPRLAQHLKRISVPTLVLWGENDRIFPLPLARYFAQHIPAAQLQVIPECGHMLPLEQPEKFAQACQTFLATG